MNSSQMIEKNLKLYNSLLTIKTKLKELEELSNELFSTSQESLLINNEIVDKDSFEILKKTENQILNELINDVIPKVSNKIY